MNDCSFYYIQCLFVYLQDSQWLASVCGLLAYLKIHLLIILLFFICILPLFQESIKFFPGQACDIKLPNMYRRFIRTGSCKMAMLATFEAKSFPSSSINIHGLTRIT